MKKILITGSTGFIGEHLTEWCLNNNHTVYITQGIKTENKPRVNGRQFYHVHFQDLDWDNIEIPDVVYHLASCTDTMVYDEDYMMQVNYHDALEFITQAVQHGVKSVVYASSAAVYGAATASSSFEETLACQPLNIYGESKARLDEECRSLMEKYPEASIVGLRYSNVYGGKKEAHKGKTASMVWQLYQKMQTEAPTLFKWGDQARDFVNVNDVVSANVLASAAGKSGIYNVGAGKMWSFNQIVDIVNELHGTTWKANYIDNPIQKFYQDFNPVNINLASKELGYKPKYSLEEGLKSIHLDSSGMART